MFTSYDTRFGHYADFKVAYRFYNLEEGGRKMAPYQGYRSDFWYEHSEHSTKQIFMIYPEFEDKDGAIITNSEVSVPEKGKARMWILAPQMRSYHRDKIKIGLVCYFMEGPRRVAECTVIEIIDLLINPRLPIEVNGTRYE
jgi:hypothetical protein